MVNLSYNSFKALNIENEVTPEDFLMDTYTEDFLNRKIYMMRPRRCIKSWIKLWKNRLKWMNWITISTSNGRKQKYILSILLNFDGFFNLILCTWNTSPAELELKDNPKLCVWKNSWRTMFWKEVKCLVQPGSIKKENDSERGICILPGQRKKITRVIFISDFRNLNIQLKVNPYTKPKIEKSSKKKKALNNICPYV